MDLKDRLTRAGDAPAPVTDFETRQGVSSVADVLHDGGAAQLFLHCYTSQPNLRSLAEIARGWERYPERALTLACPGDVVCVKDPVDRDYVEFLAGLGPAPDYDSLVVTDPSAVHAPETPLSDQIASDAQVLGHLDRLLAGHGTVLLNCYMFTEAEARLARLLESALGRAVLATGGSRAAVAEANQKHFVRARAQALGIPVAPGEVVRLPTAEDGRPRDLRPLEDAIRAWLPVTGRVIIRGTQGVSGSSTFIADSGSESRREALARIRDRSDNSIYLVEALLPTTVSPNIGLFIRPADGRIFSVSITDQILDGGVSYGGNTHPSRAATLDRMLAAAHVLAEWLRGRGMTGYAGFDFCEYEPEAGGGPGFFLSEINPRVNGATYATAVMHKVNAGLRRLGGRAVQAFAARFVSPPARTFAELRRLLGRHCFDPARGSGVVPFNTGCLAHGRCAVAILGESLDQVGDISRGMGL